MSQQRKSVPPTTVITAHGERGCGNEECGWTGATTRMCGGIGPLCPECGETTELLCTPSTQAEEITRFLETVDVGFALAAGKRICEDTIADHLAHEQEAIKKTGKRSGLYLLLRFPELRGVMSYDAAKKFADALAKDAVELADQTVSTAM